MVLALISLKQIIIMLIILAVGMICFKVGIINKESNKSLSNLLLLVVNPIVIFVSYQREFSPKLLKGLFLSILLSVVSHIVGIIISNIAFRKNRDDTGIIERFAIIYTNCGFIGIPLVKGLFGTEGVFYLTAYITVFNLFLWTHGVFLMSGIKNKKTIKEALLSVSIIATVIGFLFFVFNIQLPSVLLDSLNSIGMMNTPLAMIISGVTIAQSNFLEVLKKIRIYYVTIIKLIIVPIVILFFFQFLPIEKTIICTVILATSCPTAATSTLFSIRYGKDPIYASEIFTITTILSMITIPFIMFFAS